MQISAKVQVVEGTPGHVGNNVKITEAFLQLLFKKVLRYISLCPYFRLSILFINIDYKLLYKIKLII